MDILGKLVQAEGSASTHALLRNKFYIFQEWEDIVCGKTEHRANGK